MSITELDNEEKNKLEEQQESNSTSCHTHVMATLGTKTVK